jgi:hypothetical protein
MNMKWVHSEIGNYSQEMTLMFLGKIRYPNFGEKKTSMWEDVINKVDDFIWFNQTKLAVDYTKRCFSPFGLWNFILKIPSPEMISNTSPGYQVLDVGWCRGYYPGKRLFQTILYSKFGRIRGTSNDITIFKMMLSSFCNFRFSSGWLVVVVLFHI